MKIFGRYVGVLLVSILEGTVFTVDKKPWWEAYLFKKIIKKNFKILQFSTDRLNIIGNFFQSLLLSILLYYVASGSAYINFEIPYLLELVTDISHGFA